VRPGEVTLAHGGVLFLDELPELRRDAIESLRSTMEAGVARIARVHERVSMPARPLVVAAMNPCPCGYAGDDRRVCQCSPDRVERYRGRVSGPLLDRFDMHVAVPRVPTRALRRIAPGESSEVVRARVCAARARGRARGPVRTIRDLTAGVAPRALRLLDRAVDQLGLSARAWVKVLRLAWTIAYLADRGRVTDAHVAEAVQYRLLDRDRSAADARSA
jgi:magnesium chelatase family protein